MAMTTKAQPVEIVPGNGDRKYYVLVNSMFTFDSATELGVPCCQCTQVLPSSASVSEVLGRYTCVPYTVDSIQVSPENYYNSSPIWAIQIQNIMDKSQKEHEVVKVRI
jgi:hypothetical protein